MNRAERLIDRLLDLRHEMRDGEVVLRLAAFVLLYLPLVLPLKIYWEFRWKR